MDVRHDISLNALTDLADFISNCKIENHENADKRINDFCKEKNIILIKPLSYIHPIKLLEGYRCFLKAQEYKQTVLEVTGKNFGNAYVATLCDVTEEKKQKCEFMSSEYKKAQETYRKMLIAGTEYYSFHSYVALLLYKNLSESDDIGIPEILNRLTIAKKELSIFQNLFHQSLFPAFIYAFFATLLFKKLESAKLFADLSKTNIVQNNNNSSSLLQLKLPEFLRFQNTSYQQTNKLANKEISFCRDEANKTLLTYKCDDNNGNEQLKVMQSLFPLYFFNTSKEWMASIEQMLASLNKDRDEDISQHVNKPR